MIYFWQQLTKLIKKYKKIFICATEQSGDNIGFNIISELIKNNQYISFEGVGGNKMSTFFKKKYFSFENFNSIGIIEIIFSINKFISMINVLVDKILANDYDLIITIDSPDFNYPLAKSLRKKKYNKKIIHIVAPTVWAWRYYRAKQFSNIFNELLVLFEFEKKYFTKYGLKTTFIGHPVYYINPNQTNHSHINNIAFLPGSRKNEVIKLLPYFFSAYKFILKNNLPVSLFIPTLPHLENIIKNYVKDWKIKILVTSNLELIEKNYCFTSKAIVCSGTASLEIAKRNIPQLVIYKLNIFTELILKIFVKVKFANIINIFENKLIIPEITNSALNNISFLRELNQLLFNKELNIKQIKDINNSLKKIQQEKPPFHLASLRILSYL